MISKSKIRNLEKRLGYFLSSSWYAKKSNIYKEFVAPMMEVGRVCLFGGVVRDLMLQNASHFSSDLDFVIEVENESKFNKLVKELNPIQNSFGGFRTSINGCKVDFWDVRNTWVNQYETLVNVNTLECLMNTTFFNLDAAIYVLPEKKVYIKDSFHRGIEDKVLDINLKQNPHPDGAAVRAIRRMWLCNLSATDDLVDYICDRIDISGWDVLVSKDNNAYPSKPVLCSVFQEKNPSSGHFKSYLGKGRILPRKKQLSFSI